MNTTGNTGPNAGQHHKLVPISEVATVQGPSVSVFPRQSTQPSLPAPIPKPAIPSNANIPTPPLPTNKLIARIPKPQPNRPGTPIPPVSTSTTTPSPTDCWKRQPFSEVLHMNPYDGIRYVKRYYECVYSLDDCRAQKIVHCLPQGDSVSYLWAHNHPPFTTNPGQSASNKENVLPPSVPKPNPPKPKTQTPSTGSLQQSFSSSTLLSTPEKTKRPLLKPAPFHTPVAGTKRHISIQQDTEEFEDNKIRSRRKKRSKAKMTCKHCNQRKKNQSCDLGMCLGCCSTFDEPCSIKEHDVFKQPSHHYNDTKKGEDVCEFLIDLQLDEYLTLLLDNGFNTLQSLRNLNKDLLSHLGITRLGHQVTLLSAIDQI